MGSEKKDKDNTSGWFDGIFGSSPSIKDIEPELDNAVKSLDPQEKDADKSSGSLDGIFGSQDETESKPDNAAKNLVPEEKGIDKSSGSNRDGDHIDDSRKEFEKSPHFNETDKGITGWFSPFLGTSGKPEETKSEKHQEDEDNGWLSGFFGSESGMDISGWVGILSYEGINYKPLTNIC